MPCPEASQVETRRIRNIRLSQELNITEVSRTFGDNTALDRMNLRVEAGAFLALLGPSGCGKTTTLRIVAGFERPDSGAVTVGGHDILALPPNKRNLGMMFQDYALFPHMSVGDNVAFGLKMQGMARAARSRKAREALALVRLPNVEDRMPHQLSGGQKQRVALARSIVTNPSLLLLDEPLSALDKNLRESMQFELKRIQSELGITTVMVTHDQDEALTLSDQVAVMNSGRLIQVGTPFEIYNNPQTRFVAEFLGAANILSGVTASGTMQIGDASPISLKIQPTGNSDAPASLGIRPENIHISAERGSFDNNVPAVVSGYVFRGTMHAYQVRIAGLSEELLVYRSTASRMDGQEFAIGQNVWIGWQIGNSFPVLDR